MIRFVDLRQADIVGGNFAFFDTVRDEFVTVCGSQAWECWEEFESDVGMESVSGVAELGGLDRFRRLVPDWAHYGEEAGHE